jgi:hypothetical protein
MIDLNSVIDTGFFNKLLIKGGTTPIITKKNVISMKAFITILLKLFRKDYLSRKNYLSRSRRGGFYDDKADTNLGIFNVALKYGELDYNKSYEYPVKNLFERDFI